jgi:hypothetical protein
MRECDGIIDDETRLDCGVEVHAWMSRIAELRIPSP